MNRLIILLIGLLALTGCNDLLDREPLGRLDAGSFFQTGGDAVSAINAAYEPLMFNNANNNFFWAMGVVTSDNAVAGGDGSRPGIVEMDFFTYTSRTQEFNDFWVLNYNGITQCNTVLAEVPEIDMDPEVQDRIIGEAYFLRSFYYFWLTQVFGEVPLILEVLPPDELKVPKASRSDILNQIIADCDRAAERLPDMYGDGSAGRATRGAAYGLAAKANLYLENWEGVLEYIDRLESLGIYALVPDYTDNFREGTQNNSESVWEIQHTNLELGLGNFLNQWWSSNKYGEGYGFAEVTQDLVDEFETGDPRRPVTLAMNNDPYFELIYKPSFSSTRYSPRKYVQSDSVVTQKADGDINYTAIRYADVLLWKAEALVELGRTSEALEPLEQVRARAREMADNPANILPPVTTTDATALMEAIRHERRVELAMEMHRFFDLVRWGLAAETLEGFQTNKHEFFPIPQIELDLNGNLTQNQGY
jgi:starch-binding outer membrane protein, SusD/RagB family